MGTHRAESLKSTRSISRWVASGKLRLRAGGGERKILSQTEEWWGDYFFGGKRGGMDTETPIDGTGKIYFDLHATIRLLKAKQDHGPQRKRKD